MAKWEYKLLTFQWRTQVGFEASVKTLFDPERNAKWELVQVIVNPNGQATAIFRRPT